MALQRYNCLQDRDRLVCYCNRRCLMAEWQLDWHHADKWFQLLGSAERKYRAAGLLAPSQSRHVIRCRIR